MSELKCAQCNREFSTIGGLELHMKVFHKEAKVEAEKPKPKKKVAKKTPQKSADELSHDQYVKKSQEAAKAHATKMKSKHKATRLTDGQKVTKAELTKIFYPDMIVNVLWEPKSNTTLKQIAEASYKATVSEMKNDWVRVTLIGKKTTIAWTEGPVKGKYRLAPPRIRRM
jgi:hypothetical protein